MSSPKLCKLYTLAEGDTGSSDTIHDFYGCRKAKLTGYYRDMYTTTINAY